MKELFIGFGISSVSFLLGSYFGAELYRRMAIKRMKKIAPLVQNALVEVVEMSLLEGLPYDEMMRRIREEVDFIKIAADSLGDS